MFVSCVAAWFSRSPRYSSQCRRFAKAGDCCCRDGRPGRGFRAIHKCIALCVICNYNAVASVADRFQAGGYSTLGQEVVFRMSKAAALVLHSNSLGAPGGNGVCVFFASGEHMLMPRLLQLPSGKGSISGRYFPGECEYYHRQARHSSLYSCDPPHRRSYFWCFHCSANIS